MNVLLSLRFLGTAGQNISDIVKYSSMDDHLEILESTLRLRHLAPTAPDTLGLDRLFSLFIYKFIKNVGHIFESLNQRGVLGYFSIISVYLNSNEQNHELHIHVRTLTDYCFEFTVSDDHTHAV